MIQSVYNELLTEEEVEEVREAGEGEVHFATVAYTRDAVLPPLILSTDEGVSVGKVETQVVEGAAFGAGDVTVAEGVDIGSFKFVEEPLTEEERKRFLEKSGFESEEYPEDATMPFSDESDPVWRRHAEENNKAKIRCLVCGWSEELLPGCNSQLAGVSCDCYE
jgi:hypothetical protein